MKHRLVSRADVHRVMNRIQLELPIRVIRPDVNVGTDLFVVMLDFDTLVAELNDLVYKVTLEDS